MDSYPLADYGSVPWLNRLLRWRSSPSRLLSAEDAAAAITDVANGFLVVDYVELQASDQGERYQTRLDLTTLKLVSDAREAGVRGRRWLSHDEATDEAGSAR